MGLQVDAEVILQMEELGVPAHVIEAARGRVSEAEERADDDFAVWEDCWDTVSFFLDLRGQWSYVSGMAVARVGMPFQGIESALRMSATPRREWPQWFADMKAMVGAVLDADHELKNKG